MHCCLFNDMYVLKLAVLSRIADGPVKLKNPINIVLINTNIILF